MKKLNFLLNLFALTCFLTFFSFLTTHAQHLEVEGNATIGGLSGNGT